MKKTMYFRTSSFTIYDGTRVYGADWSYDGKQWFPWNKHFDSEIESKIYIDHLIDTHNNDAFQKIIMGEKEYREYREKFPLEVYQWWEDTCKK